MIWTEAVESFLQDSDFYRRALAAFCEWYAGTYDEEPDPELVNEEDARDWRSYLSGVRKLSASAVNLHLAAPVAWPVPAIILWRSRA